MRLPGLVIFIFLGLQGCVSSPTHMNKFSEGNYAEVVAEVTGSHQTLDEVPLHKLYLLCPAYYEIREYEKFTECADYVLAHPDPGTEFYPGLDFTYVNKLEFQGYVKSYQAKMLLEFTEYEQAYKLAGKAYTLLKENTSTEVNEGRLLSYLVAPLEVQALSLIYRNKGAQAQPYIEELSELNYYSPGRSNFLRIKQTALGRIYFAQKDYARALDILRQDISDPLAALVTPLILMVENVSTDADVREGALRTPELYMLSKSYFETGDINKARQGFDTLLANPIINSLGEIHWAALKDRAVISWQQQAPDEAIEMLRQAVEIIESQRSTIRSEAYKIGFVGDKQAVYELLVKYLLAQNRIGDAFVYAEKAKARALVDMLAQKQSFAGDSAARAGLAELAELESQMQRTTVAAIKNSARTRGLILRQREALEAQAPEVASLVSVGNVDTLALQQQLNDDEQLIEFFGNSETLYAFIVDREQITVKHLNGRGLADKISRFRQDIMQTNSNAWQQSSKAVHETLIEPLQSSLTADKLVIVPHGPLHYLPFAALFDGADFMLEQYSLRVLPSASVMAYLKTPQRSGQTTMLALGNPALGDPALDLPGAQNEVRALGDVVPESVVAVREQATESLFKRYAARVPVLHIASHGEFNPEEPLSSRLLLVGDESNDGSLTVGELYDLELNSELVTLSACQTGLGDVQSGDDVIGLTRGFLFAGAANIVASLWMVDDEATARLMVNLYHNLQSQDKQQSLRNAQLSVKNNYQAHPYYWAAFQLTGSGR